MIKKISVSLSDSYIDYIERQCGVSFSEKLRRIIDRDRISSELSDAMFYSDLENFPEQIQMQFEE